MVSPFFRRAQAPYCHRMGAASERVPLQTVVATHQRAVAQLQPLIKNLPEPLQVTAGGKRHIH